jgi:hypothetical protein
MKNDTLLAAFFLVMLLASIGIGAHVLFGAMVLAGLIYLAWGTILNQGGFRPQPKRVLAVQPLRIYRRK